ncbi:Lichenan-specific phosphotransferase enzyme IIB component [compost metagenome]
MKKLLICCLFGNTANSLAKKMQNVANEHGYKMIISAVGVDNFASVAPAFDCFLVTPHIQYKLDELKKEIGPDRPVAVIESYPFASLDGEKVLAFALDQMPQLRERE